MAHDLAAVNKGAASAIWNRALLHQLAAEAFAQKGKCVGERSLGCVFEQQSQINAKTAAFARLAMHELYCRGLGLCTVFIAVHLLPTASELDVCQRQYDTILYDGIYQELADC